MRAVECGLVRPLFVPKRSEIHAESTRDIGTSADEKWAKTKLTPEFQARLVLFALRRTKLVSHHSPLVTTHAQIQLKAFDFVSPTAVQNEMCEILQVVDRGVNFERFSPQAYSKPRAPQPPKREEDECCCVLQ